MDVDFISCIYSRNTHMQQHHTSPKIPQKDFSLYAESDAMECKLTLPKKRGPGDGSHAVKRPFKSPLRKGPDAGPVVFSQPVPTDSSSQKLYINSTIKWTSSPAAQTPLAGQVPDLDAQTSSATTPKARISALQREMGSLQLRLARQREEIDTLDQAINILDRGKLGELEILIQRWRSVSRDAAEDLFVSAKDKVNRMGGVRVYNEKIRKRKMRQQEWGGWDDKQDENDDEDEELGSDIEREKERRKAELEEMISLQEKGEDEVEDEEESENDDETFTIDMMLKGLNVDLKVIGFDKAGQRWID
ncbi:putative DNA repair protein Dds20/Mei5 [Trichophyton interdigitale]|nr:putative DNA repair protein Dds20/Mei5 [Trichophyton interdigitale]